MNVDPSVRVTTNEPSGPGWSVAIVSPSGSSPLPRSTAPPAVPTSTSPATPATSRDADDGG